MSSLHRPGKTAPRLIQDLYDYDPAHPPGTLRNLLSQVPPVYPERYEGPLDHISPSACRHQYVTKANQSSLLQQGSGSSASVKVAAMCAKCRYHLQVLVSNLETVDQRSVLASGHIHHLVYMSGRQKGGAVADEVTSKGQLVETFHYECSYLTCSAAVSVRLVSPVLDPDWVRVLIDPVLLKARVDAALAAYPERFEGVVQPLPITVLENLRAYISNALHDPQRSKSISVANKRFMMCFGIDGEPCRELLEFLEFRSKNENFWEPPLPSPWTGLPYQDPLRIFLDDVVYELTALIEQRPLSEKKGHQPDQLFHSAYENLSYALGVLDYPKAVRLDQFEMSPAPYYEDLGVVEDMPASAVIEAYNRQVSVDPARVPLYLKCLKSIGFLRGGEDARLIDNAVNLAYSEGKYTDEDVVNAYKWFTLPYDDLHLTEDNIIGKFYAFLSSSSATHETEARRQLWIIGDSRRSERIKSAAEDRVSTAEQAQVFLGVDDKTSDDFIITMYTAKINDSPSSKDIARRAVELIAKARNSGSLTHFLNTGETKAAEMDVGDAYRLLQIPDRTVDDAAIVAAYTICVDEAPAQIETYNRALSIIAAEKDSSILSSLVSGTTAQQGRVLSEWPVGLQNIGNTCYLNSLLQFYFSVRPFREMVLDLESFKMDLKDSASLAKKQVGSRKVTIKEVERSQKFLRELRCLFHSMISSNQSWVTPDRELARLTLISPTNEAAIRRRSTISAGRFGGLGEINGAPILGPLGPPPQQPQKDASEIEHAASIQSPTETETSNISRDTTMSDVESEATVVPENIKESGPTSSAHGEESDASLSLPGPILPELEAAGAATPDVQKQADVPLSRPPPVPPRPVVEVDRQKQLQDEVEIGAQQDVTEVINNVLFQSQCAIKPTAFAADGEQLDPIKDLFYGKTKSYIASEGAVRSKEEWWCDIKVDVATGSRDIYAALDGAFDVQKVDLEGKVAEQFGAISKIPPVLQIQVQRVQFDPVKKSSFKSINHLELKETIYLDRYMDTQQHEIFNRRKRSWELKDRLKALDARRAELLRKNETDGLDMAGLFDSAKVVLEDLGALKEDPDTADEAIAVDRQLLSELNHFSEATKAEISRLEQEIQDAQTMIASQFADFKSLPYRLYAVFIHRGSVSFGHYWIYIYDFNRHIWRKYNDEYVTEVQDADEIFKNHDRQNPPTPYFLVYINDGIKDRLVDPVCREIPEPAQTATHDEHSTQGGQAEVENAAVLKEAVSSTTDSRDPPSNDDQEARVDQDPPSSEQAAVADASPLNPLKRKGVEELKETIAQ